jgi:hypothetical protein
MLHVQLKNRKMINFKELLKETLAENQMETLLPSREYTEDERVYLQGYTDALNDVLEDFNAEYDDFIKHIFTPSLN